MKTSGIGDPIEYIIQQIKYHKKRACNIRNNGYSIVEYGYITLTFTNNTYYLNDGLHRTAILLALKYEITDAILRVRRK